LIWSKISGVMRALILPLLLLGMTSGQDNHALKVNFVFPDGFTGSALMSYARHDEGAAIFRHHFGVPLQPGASFVEIPATADRFRAQVWAAGCKVQRFDVPVEKSDIELQFVCNPLKTIPLYGRVKGVEVGSSTKISVFFTTDRACFWLDRPIGKYDENQRFIGCGMQPSWRVGTTYPAADGTFMLEVPDFSSDPIAAGEELNFDISGLNDIFMLEPQPAKGIRTTTLSIGIAPAYPEITFLAVPLKDFSR
jgi:hypothetical protein